MRRLIVVSLITLVLFLTGSINNKAVAQFGLSITKCADSAAVIALIDTVFLDGVNPNQYKNITFTGDPEAVGYFNGGYIFGFNRPQGIVMSSGFAEDLEGSNTCTPNNASGNTSGGSDSDLQSLCGFPIQDACIIEFDFMPTGDTARFNYVFGSEEYHDWVNSDYNDVFGFFLSGNGITGPYTGGTAINIATIPGLPTPTAVSINTVNCGKKDPCDPPTGGPNCEFLYDNTQAGNPSYNVTVLDAYTSPFVADNETESCKWYHIKLAIGDAGPGGDYAYDSGVFLEKGSFDPGSVSSATAYSHPTVDSLLYEDCSNHEAVLYFEIGSPRADPYIIPYQVLGTATEGEDYLLINTGHQNEIYIEPGNLYDSIIIRPFLDFDIEGIEDIRIVYNPVMCGFSVPDTIITLLSDVPDFPDTNRLYNVFCEDTIAIGFNGLLEGVPPYNYEWYNSVWPVSVGNNATMDISMTGTDSDFWYAVITDTCGYQSVDTAFVIVPDLETDAGPDKSLCNQPSVTLEGLSIGAQNYNWLSDPLDPTIIGQGNDTIIVSPPGTTEYILVATDNCTNSDSDTTYATLDGAVANASDDGSICLGDSITLSCNLGNNNETYIWSANPPDNGLTSQNTNQTIKVAPTGTTTYTVEVTDDCNFQATDEVIVIVHDLPVASAGSNDDICRGEDYTLSASGGIGYQWGSIPLDPSLTLNQQDTLANPVINPDSETVYKYFVQVTNENGCIDIDTMELTVNHVPDIQLSPDNETICFGDTVVITAIGDIADNYVWDSEPTDPSLSGGNLNTVTAIPDITTTYSLVATIGGINCPAVPEYEITVIPQLFANFEIADDKTETCENESIGIFYTGNASINAYYNWDFGSDAIINSGSNQGPYSVVWPTAGTKTISLSLTESNCPSDYVEINVDVFAMPTTEFIADPESGCAELEVLFTNQSSDLDEATYEWNIEGNISTDTNALHVFANPGLYEVSLTTTNRSICSNPLTKSNYITVNEIPTPEFDADPPETILEEGVINFINNSSSSDIMSYLWDFGDSDSSNLENPDHQYTTEGQYLVKLIATTSFGCIDSTSKSVTIHPDFAVFPPNAFTPNGDGENDFFVVNGTGISAYAIRIYSRWGELMFESQDITDHWDGSYKGSQVPPGTYVYKINYRSMIDRDYSINGTVTIIR